MPDISLINEDQAASARELVVILWTGDGTASDTGTVTIMAAARGPDYSARYEYDATDVRICAAAAPGTA